jgi:XTP/dITP diphosphohydrolase
MQEIIVATGNQGKMREIAEWLSDFPYSLSSLRQHFNPPPRIQETGATFEENALAKARWVHTRTGIWSLADDSGLEVDCLDGRPGVYSARYAGENATDQQNLNKLLEALKDVPLDKRTAQFRCVIALITDDGGTYTASGLCRGRIGSALRGTNGFGYDPVFIPTGFSATFGELDSGIKQSISHRGKALLNLRKQFQDFRRRDTDNRPGSS